MNKELFDLSGKVAVVTGGNGGIGKGIVDGLALAGADIAIAARNAEKTEKAVRNIKETFGIRALGIQVNVADEDDTRKMADHISEQLGRIDILVNNAGIAIPKMPQDFLPEEWDKVIEINLRGPFLCSQAVYPMMKSGGGGKIINIGSMTSIFGGMRMAPYGASKGGIVQLTRSLAVAWGADNIQVNAILPGWIETELGVQAQKINPGFREKVIARTPAARWGAPEDIAGISIFLSSRASDFLTGTAIPVDGGYSVFLV
jgi:2-deoxy-D-gluconate 3-dehydrogenase